MSKSARELYPDAKERLMHFDNYDPIINSFGNVILRVDDHDYQGDSRVLYEDGEMGVGMLIFGWGSCSGCDSLKACETFKECDELIEQLKNKIIWKESRKEMLDYIHKKDWEGEYSYHSISGETKKFIQLSVILLED